MASGSKDIIKKRKQKRDNKEGKGEKNGHEHKVHGTEKAIKAKEIAIKAKKRPHSVVVCDLSSSSRDVELSCTTSFEDSDDDEV